MKCERCGAEVDAQDALCRSCGHIRNVQRSSSWPIVVVVSMLVMMGGTFFIGMRQYAQASKMQPKNDLVAMHPIAEKWVHDHEGDCPTPERLRAEKELSASSKIDDPWGSPYRITCDGENVTLHCDGADRRADTADDLHYP